MPIKVKWGVEGGFEGDDFDPDDFSVEVNVEDGLKIKQSFDPGNGLKAKMPFDFELGLMVKE